jgi:hypothetical protein
MKSKPITQVLFFLLLAALLASCGSRARFVAPEIDPPSDLIPGYVPKGFELGSGFKVETSDMAREFIVSDERGNSICGGNLLDSFFDLKSPANNDLLGVYYESDEQLIMISKSYYPGGSLDLWQSTYEASFAKNCDCDCDCGCGCLDIVISGPVPLRVAEFREVRTINGTRVAILKNPEGWVTVFVRGEYLIAVESDVSLEENLKVVESLLQ